MSDQLTVACILALTTAGYAVGMWTNVVLNDRADEIRAGSAKGGKLSTSDRWLLLYTNWLPYVAFVVGYLVITAVAMVELAGYSASERVQLLGRMCGIFFGGGAVFVSVLGAYHFIALRKAVLASVRDGTKPAR